MGCLINLFTAQHWDHQRELKSTLKKQISAGRGSRDISCYNDSQLIINSHLRAVSLCHMQGLKHDKLSWPGQKKEPEKLW